MPLSPEEAAQTLRELERTGHRSVELRGYAGAAPHFILWGLVWACGYGLSDYFPEHRNLIWGPLVFAGSIGGFILGWMNAPNYSTFDWRFVGVAGTVAGFFIATSVIMAPLEPRQIDAFIPVIFAVIYTVAGLWLGNRFTICGLVLGFMTLLGFFLAGSHFGLWMAAVGGGILVLTGLWLRRA